MLDPAYTAPSRGCRRAVVGRAVRDRQIAAERVESDGGGTRLVSRRDVPERAALIYLGVHAPDVQPPELARTYYRAIDHGDYDALADLLAPHFAHERPDRTLDGRDRFVAFMRDERPRTDTTHEIDAVFEGPGGVAVRGRLLGSDGDVLFAFVDAFDVADGELVRLTTYTE